MIVAHRGLGGPDNSLPAFQRALDEGIDGIEMDIRLGRDGVLFCAHDRVSEGYPLEKISHRDRKMMNIPTLDDVLELAAGFASTWLFLEAKTREAGMSLIESVDPDPRRVLISFSDGLLQEATGWEKVFLSSSAADVWRDLGEGTRPGPSLQSSITYTKEELQDAYIWTVNDLQAARHLKDAWALATDYPLEMRSVV